ncbi:ABC transporter permease [Paenibacillus sp. PL91]|uniref:ABC transporter permease n=1 Tax=Paenibacillus sp. PL91 TaxID=2729538 RepID=UPI001CB93F07|nr:ABC transporter permease [Paenibacillus sp. PL91]
MLLRRVSDQLGIGLAIILLFVSLTFLNPYFLDFNNLMNVLLQVSISSILAVGMTFVIIAAGIDLSVGPLTAFSSVILGMALHQSYGVALPLLLCVLIGAILGLVNGIVIAKLKVPAFIATLGMMSIVRGLALYITNGQSIHMLPESFIAVSSGNIGGIPLPVVYAVAVAIIGAFVLNYTKFGRYVYAIGGNKEAARLSGIRTSLIEVCVYIISGITCGIGAIILAGRLNAGQPIAGVGYELDAIAAVIIGGTSLSGGEGKISGTIMGAVLIGMLRNGLNLMNVSPFLQQIIIGAVIIGAVFYDQYRRSKRDNLIAL